MKNTLPEEAAALSHATGLGLLLLEFETDPLRRLGLVWWDQLRPGAVERLQSSADAPESVFRAARSSGLLGLLDVEGADEGDDAGGAPPRILELQEAKEQLQQGWLRIRQALCELESRHEALRAQGGLSALQEARLVVLEQEAVAQRAEEWLQWIELVLVLLPPKARWLAFKSQLVQPSTGEGEGQGKGKGASEPSFAPWPHLGPLGRAWANWAWGLGIIQLHSLSPPHPLRPEDLLQVVQRIEGPSLLGQCMVQTVLKSLERGSRVGLLGLRWLVSQLYGPSGLWVPVPSLREPLYQRLSDVLCALEGLFDPPLERKGSAASEACGFKPFLMAREDEFLLWGCPAWAAIAVATEQVLDRLTKTMALRPGSFAIPDPDSAFTRDLACGFPAAQRAALAARAEGQRSVAKHHDFLADLPLHPFEARLSRELVLSACSFALRYGHDLMSDRFYAEPPLFRREFSAWCLGRLALWDGLDAEQLQSQIQPLTAGSAEAPFSLVPRLSGATRAWLYPLGLGEHDEPLLGLPQLSEHQRLDWRVRELLIPLMRAVLGLLFQQLSRAQAGCAAELAQDVRQDQAKRLEEALEADLYLRSDPEALELALQLGRADLCPGGGKELFEHQAALLQESPEKRQEREEQELDLLLAVSGLQPAQALGLRARWLEAALGETDDQGSPLSCVRLRPYLVELGKIREMNRRLPLAERKPEAELLAEQLQVTARELRAWEEAQPFSRGQARKLADLIAVQDIPLSRFGSLAETLMDEEAHEFAPCWLQRQLVEEA
jgi:hypothetical protein